MAKVLKLQSGRERSEIPNERIVAGRSTFLILAGKVETSDEFSEVFQEHQIEELS